MLVLIRGCDLRETTKQINRSHQRDRDLPPPDFEARDIPSPRVVIGDLAEAFERSQREYKQGFQNVFVSKHATKNNPQLIVC